MYIRLKKNKKKIGLHRAFSIQVPVQGITVEPVTFYNAHGNIKLVVSTIIKAADKENESTLSYQSE